MISVGLDVSLTHTSIVALSSPLTEHRVKGQGPELVSMCNIVPDKAFGGVFRLDRIVVEATSFFDNLAMAHGAVDIVVFEGPGFGSQVAHSLGCAHGSLKLALWRAGHLANSYDFPPSCLKQFATGKGHCDKNVVMKEVLKQWGFDSDDDNLVDAYACAVAGIYKLVGVGTALQQKAVSKFDGRFYARDGAAARKVSRRPRKRRVA